MPFLFAFYAMLVQAIEIRGADFLRLDPRPVARRSAATSRRVLMGADDVLAAEDHADDGRSDAAEDHDVHAVHDHVHDAVRAGRAWRSTGW